MGDPSPGTEIIPIRVPLGTKQRIADVGGAGASPWIRDLVLRTLDGDETSPRWRPLLGARLADRVVDVEPVNPGEFCRKAIEHFVIEAERQHAAVAARASRRASCSHPAEARSPIGRCTACGQGQLPSGRSKAVREAKAKARGRRRG